MCTRTVHTRSRYTLHPTNPRTERRASACAGSYVEIASPMPNPRRLVVLPDCVAASRFRKPARKLGRIRAIRDAAALVPRNREK
jgi:hypothetical protein